MLRATFRGHYKWSPLRLCRRLHVDSPPQQPTLTSSYVHGTSSVSLLSHTVSQALNSATQRWPEREAVVFLEGGIRKTFEQFDQDVDTLAAGLLALGLNPGDRVGVWGPNSYEWILSQFATAKAGMILVSLNPAYLAKGLGFTLRKVQCKAVICPSSFKTQKFCEILRKLCPEIDTSPKGHIQSSRLPDLRMVIVMDRVEPGMLHFQDAMEAGESRHQKQLMDLQKKMTFDDPINIQFTSGTTGKPKAACLSHHNIVNNAYFVGLRMGYGWKPQVRVCMPAPLHHCFGSVLGGMCMAVHGITLVFPSRGYDSRANLRAIQNERCNILYATPTMIIDMLNQRDLHTFDLSSLEGGLTGGSPCPPEVMKRIKTEMNVKEFTAGYGTTENSPASFLGFPLDIDELKLNTVGCILPHTEAKVVDPVSGVTVPLGASGELLIRGSCVMLEYWDDEAKTREAIGKDGWYRTGDIARLNSRGYCNIEGRIKDLIIRGGENIYPAEIEHFLFTHPKVKEVQVVGVRDERLGEQVCACITLKDGERCTPDEIQAFCKGQISFFKIPHYVIFVDSFPLTASGKISKVALTEITEKKLGLLGLHVDSPPQQPTITSSYVHGTSSVSLLSHTVSQALDSATQRWPERDAVVCLEDGIHKTFAQFHQDVDTLAAGLLALGLNPGDRVGVWGPNSYEWILSQFATAKAGMILVSLNPAYQIKEVEFTLKKVQCKAVICPSSFKTQKFCEILRKLCPEIDTSPKGHIQSSRLPDLRMVIVMDRVEPGMLHFQDAMEAGESRHQKQLMDLQNKMTFDDPINIQFTSGTTGNPKGACLSHHNIVNNAYFLGLRMGYHWRPQVRVCVAVPLYHCFGSVVGGMCMAVHGITLVFPSKVYDSRANLKAIQDERCNIVYGTPTMHTDMLNQRDLHTFDLSSVEGGLMGGAPCPPEIMRRLKTEMNMREITVVYGTTENSPATFVGFPLDIDEMKLNTVGCIMPHTEAKVVDPVSGVTVPLGASGELLIRGSCVMLEYWDDEAKTREAIGKDGWYRTGDIASLNSRGYCAIEGRMKDLIIRGGENIYPAEIEQFLFTHPKVKEVQVVGVRDERLGEQVCACITLKDGESCTPDEIKSFCKGQISYFKIPHYVMFVDSFPMTASGKIKKVTLKESMEKELGLQ